jgi:hypothetical protein
MKFATKTIHAAQPSEPETGSLVAPIFQTSTYEQEAPGQDKGFNYSRTNNPSRQRLEAVLADLSADRRSQAARRTLGYLQSGGDADALIAALRRAVIEQADEPHDYKYAEAVFDTYTSVPQPPWRQRFLSAGMALFKAPAAQPTAIVQESRELLRG